MLPVDEHTVIGAKNGCTVERTSVDHPALEVDVVLLLVFHVTLHRDSDSRLVEVSVLVVGRNW